ncbi:hypothetical protein QUB13_07990 [Microcoleus sp. B4-D4]
MNSIKRWMVLRAGVEKPGFFANLSATARLLSKNQVSKSLRVLAAPKIKETGFFAVFRWCIDVLGKKPVSGHTQNR